MTHFIFLHQVIFFHKNTLRQCCLEALPREINKGFISNILERNQSKKYQFLVMLHKKTVQWKEL